MKRITFLLTIISFVFFASCNGTKKEETKDETPTDTTKSIKVGTVWVTSKPNYEFYEIVKTSLDTLDIITCTEYVYSPFGIIKDKSEFKSSLLKNFSVTNRTDSMDVGKFEFNILKLNSSKLIFFFDNDPEASKHSDLFKGEIYDSNVEFVNGVKIGMSKEEFYKVFFDKFPETLQNKYNVFVLESCIEDIKHYYTFAESKLKSVTFGNRSYWKVEY